VNASIEIKDVVLNGDDLDVFTRPPSAAFRLWRMISWALALVGVFGFAATASFIHDPGLSEVLMSCGFLLLAIYGFCLASAQGWRALKGAYGRSPFGQIPGDFIFDGEGMRLASAVSTAKITWSQFEAVVENPRSFAFWASPIHALIVPKRYLDDASLEALRALISAARIAGAIAKGR
jgi:YcxB-like protein